MKGLRWQDFSGAHLHYRTFTVPRTVWPIPSIVGGRGGGGELNFPVWRLLTT